MDRLIRWGVELSPEAQGGVGGLTVSLLPLKPMMDRNKAAELPKLQVGFIDFVVNTQTISPMPVITGAAEYPQGLVEQMVAAGLDVDAFDALALAEQAGSSKAVNIVLMGHLSRNFVFTEEEWMDAIEKSVPPKFLELNKTAFRLGRNA